MFRSYQIEAWTLQKFNPLMLGYLVQLSTKPVGVWRPHAAPLEEARGQRPIWPVRGRCTRPARYPTVGILFLSGFGVAPNLPVMVLVRFTIQPRAKRATWATGVRVPAFRTERRSLADVSYTQIFLCPRGGDCHRPGAGLRGAAETACRRRRRSRRTPVWAPAMPPSISSIPIAAPKLPWSRATTGARTSTMRWSRSTIRSGPLSKPRSTFSSNPMASKRAGRPLGATQADAVRGILDYLAPRFKGPVVFGDTGGLPAKAGLSQVRLGQGLRRVQAHELEVRDSQRGAEPLRAHVRDRLRHAS